MFARYGVFIKEGCQSKNMNFSATNGMTKISFSVGKTCVLSFGAQFLQSSPHWDFPKQEKISIGQIEVDIHLIVNVSPVPIICRKVGSSF